MKKTNVFHLVISIYTILEWYLKISSPKNDTWYNQFYWPSLYQKDLTFTELFNVDKIHWKQAGAELCQAQDQLGLGENIKSWISQHSLIGFPPNFKVKPRGTNQSSNGDIIQWKKTSNNKRGISYFIGKIHRKS